MSLIDEEIDTFAEYQPAAFALAKAVSLAARVEPELLRLARLRLFPHFNAGTEADVWFCPFVASANPVAMVFEPGAADALRRRLAHDASDLPRRAWDVVNAAHAKAPPSIRLIEELTWMALNHRPREDIEAKLRPLVAAAFRDRRSEIADWAHRVHSRLHLDVVGTDAFRMLLWGRPDAATARGLPPPEGGLKAWLWSQLAQTEVRVPLAVAVEAGAIVLGVPPSEADYVIEVLDTNPILLDYRIGTHVPLVRIFLSSPGDVAEERTLAQQLIDSELPKLPHFRKVKFELIAWDDPAARIPMLATEAPQDSVNAARLRPADCDIIIVILRSRMGTPLSDSVRKLNGEPYLSGTEWEYEDAVNSPQQPRPQVLLYRCTEKPKVDLDDPELEDKLAQFERVEAFFAQFRNADGSLKGGINVYATPSEFKTLLSQHLQDVLWQRLQQYQEWRTVVVRKQEPERIIFPFFPIELRTLTGEVYRVPLQVIRCSGQVTALAVLPDWQYFISGDEKGGLRLWDLETGAELRTLVGHAAPITALAVLADGRALSGSQDYTLRLWDLETGESRVLTGHTDWVSALAVLADGRALSGSQDHTLRLWDLETGGSRMLPGHTDRVSALAVLADGRALSGSQDHTLRLWDLETGESRVLPGHTDRVSALTVLADGRALSGSQDRTLRLWNLPSLPTRRNLVFISYSHKDTDWLERLRSLLKPYVKQGRFTLWSDPYIPIGGCWQRDIEQALKQTRVAVLLVSPDFLASDFIQDEELPPLYDGAARGEITLIPIPIKASAYQITRLKDYQWSCDPETPLDSLAAVDRNRTLVKIVKKIDEAVRQSELASTVKLESITPKEPRAPLEAVAVTGRIAQLHGVPGQQPNYRRRDEDFEPLKQAVLSTTHQAIGITGAGPATDITRIGLHGMGGIGKTVLAIDLVNTEEIRRAFPDGIFWLTLGQNPEPLRLQGELARFLAGEPWAISTIHDGRDQLQQLFAGKACLLVLDDLWRVQDAEPFDVLGPCSRLLTTTRDADLLVALGAWELPLDVLSEELALDLLASWSGQARETLPPVARQVADRCGYLPLALALAGARVRGGGRWEDVRAALERGQLEFLDHPHGSVFTSLRLSTKALSRVEADRYFDLAAFPEGVDVPVETVATLWRHTGRLEAYQAYDLLRRFDRKSLLTLSRDGKWVSFHDLQHDFLRLNVDSLAVAQETLIEAYRSRCADGWATGPDDGYFFQYLPYHLVETGRLDKLKALLADYAWLAAKLKATDVPSVLADCERALDEPHLGLIERALRLSTVALARDPHQLPSQLIGRLRGVEDRRVQALLEQAEEAGVGPGAAWLCPYTASLVPPGPLVQGFIPHRGGVSALAVLPDGRVVSGLSDGILRVWEVDSGAIRVLEGHTDGVTALAVLPDGRRVSGSRDSTVRVWDVDGGVSRVLEGHTDGVTALAVLPDGRVVSGSDDWAVILWDLETAHAMSAFVGDAAITACAAVSVDRLVVGSANGAVHILGIVAASVSPRAK